MAQTWPAIAVLLNKPLELASGSWKQSVNVPAASEPLRLVGSCWLHTLEFPDVPHTRKMDITAESPTSQQKEKEGEEASAEVYMQTQLQSFCQETAGRRWQFRFPRRASCHSWKWMCLCFLSVQFSPAITLDGVRHPSVRRANGRQLEELQNARGPDANAR